MAYKIRDIKEYVETWHIISIRAHKTLNILCDYIYTFYPVVTDYVSASSGSLSAWQLNISLVVIY